MNNNNNEKFKNKISTNASKATNQAMHKSKLTLIECLLDVPEYRLEGYIAANSQSFVTEITGNVLKVKRETTIFLDNILAKIKE